MATIPRKTCDRFVKELGKYQTAIQSAKDREINEADTISIIKDILADIFGFDKCAEITSEFANYNTYCDLAVKIDGKIQYLIEAKAAGLNLKENHLWQTVHYGAAEGIRWVVLTNGHLWEIYKISFVRPAKANLVCSIDLLELTPCAKKDQEKLFLLCREGVRKGAMDKFVERAQSVNCFVVAAIVTSAPVTNVIRRELKKLTPALKIDTVEIEDILRSEVIRKYVLESDEAKKASSKIKKGLAKANKNQSQKETENPWPAQGELILLLYNEYSAGTTDPYGGD
ncbi:type I restriction and modification enzyme subunit R-like protein [Geothermobacter ehrlichii]|uniref:Type I restriction and modification enzyme subunit R-like protein n=1 Tax=Geothermobacter ehrlichii TaxID=213224 RepID=A0A5D3WNK8_9BACT|nr:type I restriction enzyme HsdR N-terminal domain-containing protein [Geothermobacter ehrlichii]TYP00152.1 type I restriction and modification enzyme subunit R-like protein [Geothermobacter ehrlichii]